MVADSSERYARLNRVLEEFADCCRQGGQPSLQGFLDRYPDLADDLRELLPAMVEMEQVKGDQGERQPPPASSLRQLGDYRILREVGRGGMGIVYEAEQESLGRHVALKVLMSHPLLESRQVQRFQREARAAARLHHSNIVPVFGVGEHDGVHYYVMQFIQGQGLDQVLDELRRLRHHPVGGRTPRDPPAADGVAPDSPSASAVARSLLTGVFRSPAAPAPNAASTVSPAAGAISPLTGAAGAKGTDAAAEIDEDATCRVAAPAAVTAVDSKAAVMAPDASGSKPFSESGRQYWQSVARIGIQVADALEYAHAQGTLHRDIKPSNLLLDTRGTVWITDFGLAKASDSEPGNLTRTGDVVGTLRYLAPERFKGKADGRSDLYALGLTLYELLTLRHAFDETERSRLLVKVLHEEPVRPRKLNPAVPRDLETIVLKAMARDPNHRYPSAAALTADLRRFLDDKPIRARPVSGAEKLWRWCRRNPAPALLASAFILSLLFGTAGVCWKWLEAEHRREDADRASQEAAAARDEAQRLLAGAMLDKGTALAQQGEVGEGLLWMLEALKSTPPSATHLGQVIRTNLATWADHAHSLRLVLEQPGFIESVALTPDGRRLYVACKELQCYELDQPAGQGSPAGYRVAWHLPQSGPVALSPDGKMLMAGNRRGQGKEGYPRRWNAVTGEAIGVPLPHPGRVEACAFSADGKRIATGGADGVVRLWDASTGKLLSDHIHHDKFTINRLAFSPDGKTLAVATIAPKDDRAPAAGHLWNLGSGTTVGAPLSHQAGLTAITFAPDGTSVLTASHDGTAQLWEAATGKRLGLPMRHPRAVAAARFHPDGRTIATGGPDGLVRWWDVATGYELVGTLPLHRGVIFDLAFSADGRFLATNSSLDDNPGTVHLWQLAQPFSRPAGKGKEANLKAPWAPYDQASWMSRQAVAYSPDASRVLTGGGPGYARLADTVTGMPLGPPLRHTWNQVLVVACSPDGRFLATSSQPMEALGEVRLWDAVTGTAIAPPLNHFNWVSALAFSPDGKILATGSYDWGVRLWDTATGKSLGNFLPQGGAVQSLAFSPDGKCLAVGRAESQGGPPGIILWDLTPDAATGRPATRRTDAVLAGPHLILKFSPDGKKLVAASGQKFRLWDPATGEAAGPPVSEQSEVNAVAFSPDGTRLLTGSTDGTARLWDVATSKPVGAPMPHAQRISVVAFSPDAEGRLILTGCADGTAWLWDAATRKPLGPPVLQGRAIIAATFTPGGSSFLTTAEDGTTRRWPLPTPLECDVDQFALILQVRTGLAMGPGQTVVRLGPLDWHERHADLAAQGGSAGDAHFHSITAWDFHIARARDAEQVSAAFALTWHLDHLLRLPKSPPGMPAWHLHARRAYSLAIAESFDEAADDDAHVGKFAGADQQLAWLRHCAVQCLVDRKWAAALWYLDRALVASPSDWQLFADRALVWEKLGEPKKRAADLEKAVSLGAECSFVAQLAGDDARAGAWGRAVEAYRLASVRGPLPYWCWHPAALAHLKGGDHQGYRQICLAAVAEAPGTALTNVVNLAAWTCVLAPNAVDDYRPVLALAEQAVKTARPNSRHNVLNTLGAVLFRAGHCKEAIQRLNEGIEANGGKGGAHDWIFLALAHCQLGETAEAQKYLKLAMNAGPHPDLWGSVELELLCAEGKSHVQVNTPANKRSHSSD